MKKILLLLTVMLAAWTIDVNAETSTTLIDVSDSPVAINWSKEASKTVEASALTTARVGDFIQVTVVGTGNMQCAIRNSSSVPVINTDNYIRNGVTAETVICYGLTAAGLAEVQASGFYLAGTNCNLKKVELISTSSSDDYSDVIFFGDRVSSYNGISLRKANFSSAQLGWTLRVHHKDLQSTHQISLRTAWNVIVTGYDYADVSGDYTDYTIDDALLTAMTESDNILIYGKSLTITKVELFNPIKTIDVETILYQGTTPLTNWSRNYEQPLSVINSLQEGDVLKVTVSQQSEVVSDYPQLRIAWGTGESQRVNWACYNYECPHTYELTLTADQVTAIQTAKKLYLNGCNITVSRWTLTQQKAVSHDRGNAATTIWSGTQVIDWNASPSTFQTIGASAFANAEAGMKMRMNFSGMKLGAQGRIVKNSWSAFDDADTFEKLPTAWGDYFEYTLTSDMVTELQANGMHVTGVGYTLTSVELIDPMKEYVINTTFDTDDIKAWELADGTPNLTVTLTNYEEQEVSTTVSASLMTDMFVDYNNYSVNITLDAGETKTIDLPITGLEPGFYRMAAKANNNQLCTYYIGYNPTAIVSPDDSQADFATFWGNWKARLAEIPVNASLTLLNGDDSDAARNIYEVSYQSVPETVDGDPVTIYGYYAEPKAAGTYPCIIHFHGTDKSGSLTMPSGTTEGWCEFRFSARGQTLDKAKNGSVKYRQDPNDESSVDFYAYRLGDNDEHYYRYVYLDTRRAVDFVFSQEKVNKSQVFAAGGSQGGCLTYVCAALSDGKVRAIAPSITGHADFVHTMEIVGWPTNVFNNWINGKVADGTYADYATGKAALLAHQSYFDTKNFASRIYCPVITNFSLQDNTDGPHLNIAPYNLLVNVAAADKEYSINQFKGHATADNWGTTYMNFFQKYIDAATPLTIETPLTMSAACYGTYYNSTAVQLPAGMMAATIDEANNSAQTLTINWRYDGDEENNIIPGGTAVMLKSDAGNYTLTLLPANTDEAPTGNLLHGSDIRTTTTGGDKYYKLTYGSTGSANADVLGWYWGAANGGAFTIGAHKAWLALTNEQANNARFFSLSDNGETTAISNLNVNDNLNTQHPSPNTQMHNLAGQKVSDAYKGIVIVNGKKVIKK
ncbi:MAG: acetylxylan esterase [Prevotella sp.]|nr:acetylxylan esterase [Prevotella sp.]